MDEADQAQYNIERDEAIAIRAAQLFKGPVATGSCLAPQCGETLANGQRWCNTDCRDEWQKSRRIYGGG